ncbi:MAG: DUF72 domain-containing protein [Chloroflexi bacterium]|nr:DUF72 domain-containing protein [Chloroflexota bacterium]
MNGIKVGCCGFPKGRPQYFAEFRVVELQQTFYKPLQLETVRRWRAQAPADFEFTLKAWQLITHEPTSPTYRKAGIHPQNPDNYGHFKPTEVVREAWQRTREIAAALGASVIIFQCPARFKPSMENIENMRCFFTEIEREGRLFVWEPRGAWDDETVGELCRALDLIHGVDPFEREPLYGRIRYFRLHGGPGYRHRYSEAELLTLKDWCEGFATYTMFNNISMYDDALRFRALLEAR